jgi:hypothetical protein
MHGRDLGYANQGVSAKSLAALLALGSWALNLDRDGRDPELPFELFDPDDIRLEDLVRKAKGAARAPLQA